MVLGHRGLWAIPILILIVSATFVGTSNATSSTGTQPGTSSTTIAADADSWVVADLANPSDPFGLRNLNYGTLLFLNVGFQTSPGQSIVTIAYLRFPLNEGAPVVSASLQLYANATYSSMNSTAIQVKAMAVNGSVKWDEMKIDYDNAPRLLHILSTTSVMKNGTYYSWDVTNATRKLVYSGELSLALEVTVIPKQVQHALFNSRESSVNTPRLVVTYGPQPSGFLSLLGSRTVVGVVLVAVGLAVGLYLWRRTRRS